MMARKCMINGRTVTPNATLEWSARSLCEYNTCGIGNKMTEDKRQLEAIGQACNGGVRVEGRQRSFLHQNSKRRRIIFHTIQNFIRSLKSTLVIFLFLQYTTIQLVQQGNKCTKKKREKETIHYNNGSRHLIRKKAKKPFPIAENAVLSIKQAGVGGNYQGI